MKTKTVAHTTSGPEPLPRAFFTLLLAAATAVTGTAQVPVYVSTGTGSPKVKPNSATIGEYYFFGLTASAQTVNANLVTIPNAAIPSLAVFGSYLITRSDYVFAAVLDNNQSNNRVVAYHIDPGTGTVLSPNPYFTIPVAANEVQAVAVSPNPFGTAALSGALLFVLAGGTIGAYDANTGAVVNASLVTGLSFPQYIAVSSGSGGALNLFVTSASDPMGDPSTGSIYAYTVTPTGATATAISPSPLVKNLNFPSGIAVSGDGANLFVVINNSTIGEYAATTGVGTSTEFGGAPGSSASPLDLALVGLGGGGEIFLVTDRGSGIIGEFDALTNPQIIDTSFLTGLSFPEGIAVGPVLTSTGDSPFQVRYASNLGIGDSVVNMTNTGFTGGNLCVSVYMFDQNEELNGCCTCTVTPDGLQSLSVRNSLPFPLGLNGPPTSLVTKLVATTGGVCNASVQGNLATGLAAWGTTIHALPVTPGSPATTYGVTETAFTPSSLSAAEYTRMTGLCGFIQTNGSGFGICHGCAASGLGAVAQ